MLNYFFLLRRWLLFGYDDSSSIVCFRYNIFLSKAEVRIDPPSPFLSKIIVASVSTIEIVVSLEPLGKLKVVLVLGFGKFFALG